MTDVVLTALKTMRPPFVLYEYDIHRMVEACLRENELAYIHEARLGPGCRIDYLVDGVGIEVKKGKPVPQTLSRQLGRYAACEMVDSFIVVSQRSVKLPKHINGKPIYLLVLSQLWGVALP